jgi:uncharacterized protein (UPF0335 family)
MVDQLYKLIDEKTKVATTVIIKENGVIDVTDDYEYIPEYKYTVNALVPISIYNELKNSGFDVKKFKDEIKLSNDLNTILDK